MATPLKLWQHSEPKRLWPALGGLSVLAHIGILGLGLPYVLELMQASDSTATETIPIELIVVSPEEELSETIGEPGQNTSMPTKEQYSPPLVSTASANNNTFSQDTVDESVVVPVQPSPEDREEILQDPKPDDRKKAAGSSDNSQASSTKTEEGETNGNGVGESESQTGEELEDADSGEVDEAPTVPTLPGEPTLPIPGDPVDNPIAPRPAALSIVSFSQAGEIQRDTGKTPPKPKEDAIAASIVLDPIAQGCGQLEFSRQQWTYRVAVRADGSVLRATIWTGGIYKEPSGEEGAIACLIENAGFQFEPALFEGQPILDDNLLITISVIEIPRSGM